MTVYSSTALTDSYVLSQDVSAIQAEARALGYLTHRPNDTLNDTLSWTGVMSAISEGPQSHAEATARTVRIPLAGIAMLILGLGFIGLGMVISWVSW